MTSGAMTSWDFGTATEYPALKADHDGDGQATWPEFGFQRAPGPVTNLAASRNAADDIVVTWSAPASPGSGTFAAYDARVRTHVETNFSKWTTAYGSSYTFTPMANTGYTVEVRVRNTMTEGGRTIEIPGEPSRIEPPDAPGDLLLAHRTAPADDEEGNPLYDDEGHRLYEGFIGVSWSAPGDCSDPTHETESACAEADETWTADAGVTGYSVQYRTATTAAFCSDSTSTTQDACTTAGEEWTAAVAAGEWSDAGWSAEDGLAVDIGGLTVDTAYDVRVAAVGALGVSPFAEDTAAPSLEERAPGVPLNVVVSPAAGGLRVTWDPPLDPGNPPFEGYEFQIQPTEGWNCNDPDTDAPWEGDEDDFPLWVAVYCVFDVRDLNDPNDDGYYPPPGGRGREQVGEGHLQPQRLRSRGTLRPQRLRIGLPDRRGRVPGADAGRGRPRAGP